MRGRPPNAAASFSLSKVSSRFHAGLLKVPAGADRTPHSSGTLADGSQLIESRHRCTRDDPTFRHRGVLLFAACAHHSSSGCGVISTGMGAGAGAGSTAGGSSGSTSMGEAGSGVILRCRGIPRGRSGAMMSMGALGGSYPCAWAVVTRATSKTRRRVIPPRKVGRGSAWSSCVLAAAPARVGGQGAGVQAAGFRSCCSRPDRMRCQEQSRTRAEPPCT
jgi:hypothetical protein